MELQSGVAKSELLIPMAGGHAHRYIAFYAFDNKSTSEPQIIDATVKFRCVLF
jgi:hypothetical protein